MKKTIIFYCFLFISNIMQAQTKEETETWLTSKINKLLDKKSVIYQSENLRGRIDYVPDSFILKNDEIKISYRVTEQNTITKEIYEDKKVNISAYIYQVKDIGYTIYKNENNIIYKGNTKLLVISLSCTCGIIKETPGVAGKTSQIYLMMDGEEEADLFARLQKAFTRLKTFYPAPKEAF